MRNLIKLSLITAIMFALTACGTMDIDRDDIQTQENAIDKIASFTQESNITLTIQDYLDAGISKVTKENIELINKEIKKLEKKEVDTKEEIEEIVKRIGDVKPEPEPSPKPEPKPEQDTTKPVITLKGSANLNIIVGAKYTDLGATAKDNKDGTVTVKKSGNVNTSKVGTYKITYTATDKAGNRATKVRTIVVEAKALTQYEEIVDIPKYDASNSTHVLITENNGNWTSSVLNDPDYKHFYVEPGEYGRVILKESGTKNNRRTISLYNGNDTHPAALSDAEQADARYHLDGASYWTIDRISWLNKGLYANIINGSSHNIFNRTYMREFGQHAFFIRYGANNYNTIQNSYFDGMEYKYRLRDGVCFAIIAEDSDMSKQYGNKFINNDVRNSGDGVQLVFPWTASAPDAGMPGTIINNNRIWVDSDIYTDRDGTPNPNGKYMVAENALDFKRGSHDSANPVIVTNNIMWGMRNGAKISGSFDGGLQTIVAIHNGAANINFENNILFDAERSMSIAAPHNSPYAAKNLSIQNNIFADIGAINPEGNYIYNIIMEFVKTSAVKNNYFIRTTPFNGTKGRFISYNSQCTNSDFDKNVVIDSYGSSWNYGGSTDNNYFYNSYQIFKNDTNTYKFDANAEAKMEDYTFTYQRYTVTPKQKTIKGIVATKASPHYGKAGSSLTK